MRIEYGAFGPYLILRFVDNTIHFWHSNKTLHERVYLDNFDEYN